MISERIPMKNTDSQDRKGGIFRKVIKLVSRHAVKLFSITTGIAAAVVVVYSRNQPTIEDISIKENATKAILLGENFGSRQGRSFIHLNMDGIYLNIRRFHAWSNQKIVLSLPPGITRGNLQVIKHFGPLRWTSEPRRYKVISKPHQI